jgi:hypothetical protein
MRYGGRITINKIKIMKYLICTAIMKQIVLKMSGKDQKENPGRNLKVTAVHAVIKATRAKTVPS